MASWSLGRISRSGRTEGGQMNIHGGQVSLQGSAGELFIQMCEVWGTVGGGRSEEHSLGSRVRSWVS